MNRHVIGLFYHPREAAAAVEALAAAGVGRGEMSLVVDGGQPACGEGALETAGGGGPGRGEALIAIGTGILAIGPLLVALASLGVGASGGGIVGALGGVGIPEQEARFYEEEVLTRGAALVGIATLRHDEAEVAAILLRNKAVNITRSA